MNRLRSQMSLVVHRVPIFAPQPTAPKPAGPSAHDESSKSGADHFSAGFSVV
jgi:hypothetical protein